jgi:hypothetical protein
MIAHRLPTPTPNPTPNPNQVLMIAHRLSTIRNADRICVVKVS